MVLMVLLQLMLVCLRGVGLLLLLLLPSAPRLLWSRGGACMPWRLSPGLQRGPSGGMLVHLQCTVCSDVRPTQGVSLNLSCPPYTQSHSHQAANLAFSCQDTTSPAVQSGIWLFSRHTLLCRCVPIHLQPVCRGSYDRGRGRASLLLVIPWWELLHLNVHDGRLRL